MLNDFMSGLPCIITPNYVGWQTFFMSYRLIKREVHCLI